MKYRESQTDKELRSWFANDLSKALLRKIYLQAGKLRGISSLDLNFDYPITAIAGVNGAGKSTILAMACCAYHNRSKGFKPPRRKTTYYTFSDFFVQHVNEIAPQGVDIRYQIAYDKWKPTPHLPEGKGLAWQKRWKAKGGKWNNYSDRVFRNVVFLGIERIVPHSERSQSRSYSRSFKDVPQKGWESKVKDAVGYVLGKNYDQFRYLEHTKYSLPIVQCNGVTYSGFNMGAGENALFEIFSNMYSAGEGALLVMDEIELGLHARAQKLFMNKLKEVCKETKTQVLCTTHSKEIFESLPDDARFFVESVSGKTKVTSGMSAEFAFSKMGNKTPPGAIIFAEDEIARSIVQAILPANIRSRIEICVIGSASALSRQLAASYLRKEATPVIAIFDGDQRMKEKDNLNHAAKMAETKIQTISKWFGEHISYLPGAIWPESWMIQKCKDIPAAVAIALNTEEGEIPEIMEYALQAGKHKEFYEISTHVGLPKDQCMDRICSVISHHFSNEFDELRDKIINLF
ncbi:AAA family ATPase [Xanthomonas sp. LF06-19]|uniref:ATP-dependent nuclease n=1 Tax=Xanthomonas sp. LF06-19 TaxID=3097551 RepID=UPI0025D21ED3|nr:AAA family ATPase [Xanthomonas sp. LF06-19]MDY4285358.1 AAA family ATPase [Xanthomonas sp. LF06-19]